MPITKLKRGEWVDSGGNVREGQLSGNSRGMIIHSNIAERYKKILSEREKDKTKRKR